MSLAKRHQYEGLSSRALTILRLLSEGLSDREIADQLVMTVNTIKWYNRQIYTILGVGSRTQAVARAHELHLFEDQLREVSFVPPSHLPPHNLASESTRFIGRQRESAAVQRLVQTNRLITLVGPPGTGKTRLALHVAHDMLPTFRDGVFVVLLAPIDEAARVVNAIASAIGVTEAHDQPLLVTVKRYLHDKHMLLVMDNFEHLLEAASVVAELLAAATHLKVLTTSREALHIYGEQEYAVPLLELPDPERADPDTLVVCESVVLFIERAHAIQPDFELTADNALTIANICVRLEGLPLAIELAAARVKLLPPTALLARLGSRLELLTGGPRDLPARQQTLRGTIDWSYELLGEEEKILFVRLAVFRGGRSLDAMERICFNGLALDPLEGIDSLVNKSLLFQLAEGKDGEPRFMMLETIHEYAWEQLAAHGEVESLRRRHAAYYVELAERADSELRRAGASHWMARLETEYENIEAALTWALSDGDTELGLRLVTALRDYWTMASRFVDGDRWLQVALLKSADAAPALRVRVLVAAGLIYFFTGRQLAGRTFLVDAIALARAEDNPLTLAWALIFLSATAIAQPTGYEESMALVQEGLALFRRLDHRPGIAQALNIIGELARTNSDDAYAQSAYEECLRVVRVTGEQRREAMILGNLSFLAMHRGDVDKAEQLLRAGLDTILAIGHDHHLIVTTIVALAGAIGVGGDPARAARLFGAAEALLEPMGVRLMPGDQPEYERDLGIVRARLNEATFSTCWNEGRAMSLEQMIAYARERND